MSKVLDGLSESTGGEGSVGRDSEIAQEAKDILELKQRVLDELEKPGFPDVKFLFSPETIPVLGGIFDELLSQYEATFEDLYAMSDTEIIFQNIPQFTTLTYLYNLIYHTANTRGLEISERLFSEVEQKFGNFRENIHQSKRFYEIICILLEREDIDGDERRVLEIYKGTGEKSGVHLSDAVKEQLEPIRNRLSQLSVEFMDNIKKCRRDTIFVVEEDIFGDMPESFRKAAREKGKEQGIDGYVFTLTPANEGALLKYTKDANIRKKVYLTSVNIAHEDNKDIVLEMIRLRKEYAQKLGFDCYADFAIQGKMAKNKEQIVEMYQKRIDEYRKSFESDMGEILNYFGIPEMSPWDFQYYKTRYISETLRVNASQVQSYLEYEKVLSGIFEVVEKVFGVKFEKTNIETYDDKVHVFMVSKDGEKLGYYMPDLFTHPGKRQGAWAEVIRKSVRGEKIMTNVGNIASTQGKQYFSMHDIRVIFHELGHMVHELLSPQSDERLSGFEVEPDAVEIPSMFFENLAIPYELSQVYLRHENTGEVIPEEIHNAFSKEVNFCKDFGNLRRLYYALFDLEVHGNDIPTSTEEVQTMFHGHYSHSMPFMGLEQSKNNVPSSFHHLFHSATGMYVAGFYSYAWSSELQKTIWDKIQETGGPLESTIMQRYIDCMLSQGARKPSMELFEAVMN